MKNVVPILVSANFDAKTNFKQHSFEKVYQKKRLKRQEMVTIKRIKN